VNDRLPQSSIVPAAAALILAFSIGSAISGPAASAAMAAFGPAGFLGYMALALAAIGLFSLARIAMKEAAEPSPQEEGVYAVTTAFAPLDTTVEEDQMSFDFSPPDAEPGGEAAS
jgi:hypothetical protein